MVQQRTSTRLSSGMISTCQELSDFHSFNSNCSRKSRNDFTIVTLNIRSMRKYWDEFKMLAVSTMSFVDVFVLTEINIPQSGLDTFSLPGFQSHFAIRPLRRGGGIAIFVKDEYVVSRIETSFTFAECLAVDVAQGQFQLSVFAFYRPPGNSSTRFLIELEALIQQCNPVGDLCLVGDFNLNTLCPTKGVVADYLALLASHGIENTITTPTREETVNGKLVRSCLDHISVRAPNYSLAAYVIAQRLADHYFVACHMASSLPVTDQASCSGSPESTFRISITDQRKLDGLIREFQWSTLTDSKTALGVYDCFCAQVETFENMSKKLVIKKRRKNHNWIDTTVMRAISERDLLWKRSKRSPQNQTLRAEYRMARNKVVALIRAAKRQYFFKQFNKSAKSPARTWALIKDLRGKKDCSSVTNSLSMSVPAVAETFKSHFTRSSDKAFQDHEPECTLKETVSASAFLPRLSEHDLRRIVFSFRRNKPPGIDRLSAHMLQRNFDALAGILLFMLNGFLDSSSIPERLKIAIVKPLHKGGRRDVIENYRPISILSILSQVLEKFLHEVMVSFMEKFSIFSPHQFGFVSGKGTTLLLESFSDEIFSAFEHNSFSIALFLDISKAFDTVNHGILLAKLHALGFRGPFHDILKSYLYNRSQIVVVDSHFSSPSPLKAGVPQGSILSPLLFNIFINDFASVISKCKVFQYADDTLLLAKHVCYQSAIEMLQNDVHNAVAWFAKNRLGVNVSKTKLVCFRNPLKTTVIDRHIYLHSNLCAPCSCVPIEYVQSIKYLGVFFDSNMSWDTHLAHLCGKLRSVAWLMYHCKSIVPFPVKKTIVHALAYGLLRYGITVFAFCAARWETRIDALLKNILRSVGHNLPSLSSQNLFAELGFPSFRSLFVRTVVLRYFWSTEFKVEHKPSRMLRSHERFVVPRSSTRYGEARRSVYIPKLFNDLPEDVFLATSKGMLKNRLKGI